MEIKGNIHSLESFGTVDGPGIRFVAFLQGCPLRCKFCHNPDTWDFGKKQKEYTPEELYQEMLKYKRFFGPNGGVTVTGGEPLVQREFVKEYFKLCKENNVHTAVDTSGYIFDEKVKEVLEYTDLVLLDIKCIDEKVYKDLTNVELENTLKFLDYLKKIKKDVWLRHVVVPTITDDNELLEKLADYLVPYKEIIKKIEVLPYHTLGKFKYDELGMDYPLKDIEPLDPKRLEEVKNIFIKKGFKL